MDNTDLAKRLEEARARRKVQIAQYTKKEAEKEAAFGGFNQTTASFPWRDLQAGEDVTIRFVADPDTNNQNFWRPLCSRRLQFRAIRQPDGSVQYLGNDQSYDVYVPAWNIKKNETALDDLEPEYLFSTLEDPLQHLVPYSDPKDGDEAAQDFFKKYKKTEMNIYFGFVTRSDAHPDWVGKLFRFNVGKGLHNVISSVMRDEEIEEIVTEIEFGHDFKLCCTSKGQYKNYEIGSKFMSKPTAMSDEMRKTLEEAHLPEFKTLINKKPTPKQCELMVAAFRAATSDGVFEASWAKAWDKLVGFGWKLENNGFLELNTRSSTPATHTELPKPASSVSAINSAIQADLPWVEKETVVETPIQTNYGNAQIKVAAPVELSPEMANLVKAAPVPGDMTTKKEIELNIVSGAPVTQPKEVERVGVAVPTPAVAPVAPQNIPQEGKKDSELMKDILSQLGI